MKTAKLIAVYRAERYSPNAVEKDRAILDEVCLNLSNLEILKIAEDNLSDRAEEFLSIARKGMVVLSMARSAEALSLLDKLEQNGAIVINSPRAIRSCSRRHIEEQMKKLKIATPSALAEQHPECRADGWWVKQSDTTDSTKNHVFLSPVPVAETDSTIVQPNIKGDCVKFYGAGKDFFFLNRPSGDNQCAKHLAQESFPQLELSIVRDAQTLAQALDLEIYGGDVIITPGGNHTIIDMNDFPSFAICRTHAAAAIAEIIRKHL